MISDKATLRLDAPHREPRPHTPGARTPWAPTRLGAFKAPHLGADSPWLMEKGHHWQCEGWLGSPVTASASEWGLELVRPGRTAIMPELDV
jgi:hypothetical protein